MHGDTVEVAVHRCQEVGDFYVALLLRNMQSLGAVLARGPREAGFELGHGRQLSQFAISLRPVAWLFSGWNWVPTMVPVPTMAVTGPP